MVHLVSTILIYVAHVAQICVPYCVVSCRVRPYREALFSRLLNVCRVVCLERVPHGVAFRQALPCSLIGMNAGVMAQYIEFVADRMLGSLGYEKVRFCQASPSFSPHSPFFHPNHLCVSLLCAGSEDQHLVYW